MRCQGGLIIITADQVPAVKQATLNYIANVKDEKSSLIVAFNYITSLSGVGSLLFLLSFLVLYPERR